MSQNRMVVPPSLEAGIRKVVILLSFGLWGFAIYYAFTLGLARTYFTVALFGVAMSIYVLNEIAETAGEGNVLDIALLSTCLTIIMVTIVYLLLNFDELLFTRTGIGLHHEYVLALIFTLVMFYLIYREFGLAFLAVILGGSLYALLGGSLPGLLGHGGLSLPRILNTFVLDFEGFFGSISGIVAAWVSLFLLYAGLLHGYGAFDYIMQVAFKSSEYVKSGIAQSAVVASLAIGSINGSQVANSAMTGSVTIPLMKEADLKPSTAGGVEAVASSGGQIMPPVMGAAGFIMASILGITYYEVLVAGIIPALVFYISVAIAVHYAAINQDIKTGNTVREGADFTRIDTRSAFIFETIKLGIPFIVLVYTLGIIQWTVTSSALYTCIAMFVTGTTFPLIGRSLGLKEYDGISVRKVLGQTVEGIKYGATIFAPIVIIVAAINGIVDILVTTGVPGKLALALINLSGGVLVIALILAMIICIILGMGMPTVAAYTIVALLVAPSLIEGFDLAHLSVHYFVFYAALLSGITPPIAIAVVVTTGIAQSNFWATAFEAVKISAPLFILPFAFIYNPEIILGGLTIYKIFSSALLLFGAILMVHGLNYYKRAINSTVITYAIRGLFVILGIVAMASPLEVVRVAALIVGSVLLGWQVTTVNGTTITRVPTAVRRRF